MSKDIDKKLENRQVKPTAMRELVIAILLKQENAISLKELEDKFAQVDKSTLFRTLKTFEKKGVIHSIDDGSGSVKYAVCHDTCNCTPNDLHVHFHCTKCLKTFCLSHIPIPKINLPSGFTHNKANFVIKGICNNCN